MKVYVQFYTRDLAGQLTEALASDSVFNLDRRFSLDSQIAKAFERARQLKQVQPHYEAFKIMRGPSYSNSSPITRLINL